MKEVKRKSVDGCRKNKKPMSRETDRLLPQQTDSIIKLIKLINLIKLSL